MGTYKSGEFGKALEDCYSRQNPVSIEQKRSDLEKIKSFIEEQTCFRIGYASLSPDELKITLRTKIK